MKKILPLVCFYIALSYNCHGQKGLIKYKKEYWLRITLFFVFFVFIEGVQ